ncbi:MAG: 50S ribosomal protein L18 [Gammaproteobacteria bacterium]|nr:50S ribosomal protein L18 [Gammaproteobacteria bacterium]
MNKKKARLRRAARTRARIKAQGVYRLSVHRTPRHIYAQIISPGAESKVIANASTLDKQCKAEAANSGNITAAVVVGKVIAERAVAAGITKVAFDRCGFKYHGRVKALAEAASEKGLTF